MDLLFCEILQWEVPLDVYGICRIAPSREEELRQLMAAAGIELVDYDAFVVKPVIDRPPQFDKLRVEITAFSRAFRERAERESARR